MKGYTGFAIDLSLFFCFLFLTGTVVPAPAEEGTEVFQQEYFAFQLSEGGGCSFPDQNPSLDADGDVAWQGHDRRDWEIFLYDGEEVRQITDNDYDDWNPEINDMGTSPGWAW